MNILWEGTHALITNTEVRLNMHSHTKSKTTRRLIALRVIWRYKMFLILQYSEIIFAFMLDSRIIQLGKYLGIR